MREFVWINETHVLGPCYFLSLAAQRPQKNTISAAISFDNAQGVGALRHGPLAHDLAGDKKRGIVGGHKFFGRPNQKDFAIDTGIEIFPITIDRGRKHL
jgi:hypothetical protein